MGKRQDKLTVALLLVLDIGHVYTGLYLDYDDGLQLPTNKRRNSTNIPHPPSNQSMNLATAAHHFSSSCAASHVLNSRWSVYGSRGRGRG